MKTFRHRGLPSIHLQGQEDVQIMVNRKMPVEGSRTADRFSILEAREEKAPAWQGEQGKSSNMPVATVSMEHTILQPIRAVP